MIRKANWVLMTHIWKYRRTKVVVKLLSRLKMTSSSSSFSEVDDLSLSVPDLSSKARVLPVYNRSISDNAEDVCHLQENNVLDQLIMRKSKFINKKKFSGLLKKPDMLETVYSVDDPDDAGDAHKN